MKFNVPGGQIEDLVSDDDSNGGGSARRVGAQDQREGMVTVRAAVRVVDAYFTGVGA